MSDSLVPPPSMSKCSNDGVRGLEEPSRFEHGLQYAAARGAPPLQRSTLRLRRAGRGAGPLVVEERGVHEQAGLQEPPGTRIGLFRYSLALVPFPACAGRWTAGETKSDVFSGLGPFAWRSRRTCFQKLVGPGPKCAVGKFFIMSFCTRFVPVLNLGRIRTFEGIEHFPMTNQTSMPSTSFLTNHRQVNRT